MSAILSSQKAAVQLTHSTVSAGRGASQSRSAALRIDAKHVRELRDSRSQRPAELLAVDYGGNRCCGFQ